MIKRIDAGKQERRSDARKSRMTEAPMLEPRYDSRQSFYGKAYYTEPARDGSITLYSYDTPVVRICADGEVELLPAWDYSQTTLRHVREFLKQQGYSAGSKAEIARMYTEVNESAEKPASRKMRTVKEDYSEIEDDTRDKYKMLVAEIRDMLDFLIYGLEDKDHDISTAKFADDDEVYRALRNVKQSVENAQTYLHNLYRAFRK